MSNDPITNADKFNALRNEQMLRKQEASEPTTLHALSRLGQDEEPGGRFAQARHDSGSAPSVDYPAASSPWTAGNDAGLEPPLGVEVDAQEPCGEAFEIERSLVEQLVDPSLVQTQSRVDQQSTLVSAVDGSGPSPLSELAGELAPRAVLTPAALVETAPANTNPIKRRRKLA